MLSLYVFWSTLWSILRYALLLVIIVTSVGATQQWIKRKHRGAKNVAIGSLFSATEMSSVDESIDDHDANHEPTPIHPHQLVDLPPDEAADDDRENKKEPMIEEPDDENEEDDDDGDGGEDEEEQDDDEDEEDSSSSYSAPAALPSRDTVFDSLVLLCTRSGGGGGVGGWPSKAALQEMIDEEVQLEALQPFQADILTQLLRIQSPSIVGTTTGRSPQLQAMLDQSRCNQEHPQLPLTQQIGATEPHTISTHDRSTQTDHHVPFILTEEKLEQEPKWQMTELGDCEREWRDFEEKDRIAVSDAIIHSQTPCSEHLKRIVEMCVRNVNQAMREQEDDDDDDDDDVDDDDCDDEADDSGGRRLKHVLWSESNSCCDEADAASTFPSSDDSK